MTRLRFGLVGTGAWARASHLPGLVAHPDVDLVGVWGRDPAAAAELAASAGALAYPDYAEMLARVDAVAIVLPPAVQAPFAIEAAGRGVHLLLEKPIAEAPSDAEALCDAIDAGAVAAVVCLPRFLDPRHSAWLDAVRAAKPSTGHVDWRNGVLVPGSPLADGWRDTSGELVDVGPHLLSQLESVLGPIVDAEVREDAGPGLRLLLRHEGGARSSADIDLRDAARDEETYTFVGGAATHRRDEPVDFPAAYARLLDDLVRRVRGGRRPVEAWTPAACVGAVRILDGLRRHGSWSVAASGARRAAS